MHAKVHRNAFLILMVGLVALTWATLWIWEQSPYGRYLNHGQWDQAGIAANLCLTVPLGEVVVPSLFYAGGWVLMILAMMLPTTLPLLALFQRVAARRPDRHLLLILVVVGYVTAWLAFGLLAHGLDRLVHLLAENNIWLTFNAWIFGAAMLMVAGAFQFTQLKYRCLDRCRTPYGFVTQHWRGQRQRWYSFVLGLHHGAFCVGCCWALMLLMFAVGTGSVGWMLVLGAVMAVEKNMPWGRKLSSPLGVALIVWGTLIALNNSWAWNA